jgi:hypothetical protein
MRLAHTQPETRTGSVGDQGGMWILVSRGDVNVILAPPQHLYAIPAKIHYIRESPISPAYDTAKDT